MERNEPFAHSEVVDEQSPQSSPRSLLGRDQTSSGTKGKMLTQSPCTEAETPKAANPSTLKATVQPLAPTPRTSQILASPVPVQHPHFQCGLPQSCDHLYLPPSDTYPRSLQGPDRYQTHYPSSSPRPGGYEFNQSPDPRISLTPLSSHLNTNTSKPPLQTPISATPTTNLSTLSTSTTTHGSTLTSSPSVDGGLERVTQKPYLSSPSDELETRTQKQGLSSPSDELETRTQKQGLSSPSDELVVMTQTQDARSLSAELKTSTHKPYFSPSAERNQAANPSTLKAPAAQTFIPRQQLRDHYQHFQWAIPPSGFSPDEREFPPLSHQIQRRREVTKLPNLPRKVFSFSIPSPAIPVKSEPRLSGTLAHTRRKKKKGLRGNSSNIQHQ